MGDNDQQYMEGIVMENDDSWWWNPGEEMVKG